MVRAGAHDVFVRVSGGEPDAVPVVHLHGFAISGAYLMPTARLLAGPRVNVVPDLPGYGRSRLRGAPLDLSGPTAEWREYGGDKGGLHWSPLTQVTRANVGEALMRHDHIGGITFTGSYAVGMHILRTQAARTYPRPCIAEMGGKNAAIVTARANLDVAAQGIVRSAFGMSGQKCSALSRVYVDRRVADALIEKLQAAVAKLAIGNPQLEATYTGPVATPTAQARHADCRAQLAQSPGARIVSGQVIQVDGAGSVDGLKLDLSKFG